MTFRRRLVLVSAAAVAGAVALASTATFFIVRDQLRGRVDSELRSLAPKVMTFKVPAPHGLHPPDVLSWQMLAPSHSTASTGAALEVPASPLGVPRGYAQVVPATGGVLGSSERGPARLPVDPRARSVARGAGKAYFRDVRVDGAHLRVYTAPFGPDAAIQVARPLDEVDANLERLGIALAAIGLGGIVVAVLLGRVVAGAALTPVRRLTEGAEYVTATRDLSRRVDASGGDELSRLGASFNTMLAALQRSIAAQRQLVADASHELRTPLTSLRTNVEVLGQDGRLSGTDRRRLRRDVVTQIDELTDLVGDLVDLARDGGTPAPHEPVRLDAVVRVAVDRCARRAHDRRFRVDAEPSVVEGAAERIDRAVSNLLDNACKWSPPGAEIEVTVRDGEVSVRDHGPGIDDADVPHVFDRFYRARSARSLPGSGLGLAIVRQVAEAHGGSVEAERAIGGGALLRMRLSADS
jgi:two-component system, OmpR family, sensor histidine kinase MprB